MNGLIIASVVINGALTFLTSANPDLPGAFTAIMAMFVALSAIGVFMIASGSKKPGAIMVIIGCAIFVPIGLIGVFGARRVLDEVKRAGFDQPEKQPQPVSHAAATGERKDSPLPLLIVLGGTVLNLLLRGSYYVQAIRYSGLQTSMLVGFFLLAAVVLADSIGAVLIYRRAGKAGGMLVLAANAIYLARCVWIGFILFSAGEGWETMIKISGPTLLTLVGGVLAIRLAAGQEPALRTGPGTISA